MGACHHHMTVCVKSLHLIMLIRRISGCHVCYYHVEPRLSQQTGKNRRKTWWITWISDFFPRCLNREIIPHLLRCHMFPRETSSVIPWCCHLFIFRGYPIVISHIAIFDFPGDAFFRPFPRTRIFWFSHLISPRRMLASFLKRRPLSENVAIFTVSQ